MEFCKDCVWFTRDYEICYLNTLGLVPDWGMRGIDSSETQIDICTKTENPVSGGILKASDARLNEKLCGIDARWYKLKEEK